MAKPLVNVSVEVPALVIIAVRTALDVPTA